jgi:hypothetical protein
MGRVRLISGGSGLKARYVNPNAGFYDRIAFDRMERSGPDAPPVGSPRVNGATVKGKKGPAGPQRKGRARCPDCGRAFDSDGALQQHRNDLHFRGTSRRATGIAERRKGGTLETRDVVRNLEQPPTVPRSVPEDKPTTADPAADPWRAVETSIRRVAIASAHALSEIDRAMSADRAGREPDALTAARDGCLRLKEHATEVLMAYLCQAEAGNGPTGAATLKP